MFCVDEKTAIQTLDRLDPVLPLSPGRIERHGFEYHRHGTLSLYAAWKPPQVACTARPRHGTPVRISWQQIHIILDNLSAHKTRLLDEFLHKNPRVQFHFTPTYSSWLNQVELLFGKIERDLIARGVFTSVPGLARKIKRYIRAYQRQAHCPLRCECASNLPDHSSVKDALPTCWPLMFIPIWYAPTPSDLAETL